MRMREIVVFTMLLCVGLAAVAQAGERPRFEALRGESPKRLFVTVTAADDMTRGMALVLANQVVDRGAEVRVLLCGPGAELALADHESPPLAPRGVTPQQMLVRLMEAGAVVEVCALFLPNTGHTTDCLLEGVGVGDPGDVADYMLEPHVHFLTF